MSRSNNGRNDNQEEQQRRQETSWTWGDAAAGAAVLGGTLYLANKFFNSSTAPQSQSSRVESQAQLNRQAAPVQQSSSWLVSQVSNMYPRKLCFWQNVEQLQNEERSSIKQQIVDYQVQLESGQSLAKKFKHPYNKFDEWFENLFRESLKIDKIERSIFQAAFEELVENLVPAMKKDSLFNFLFRELRPAGSSWENLRICSPDEYDVNVLLFPPHIQPANVEVVDLKSGHIGLVLEKGFTVTRESVVKKFNFENDKEADSYYLSITSKLTNWLDSDNYIVRKKVSEWMESVVATALNQLENKQWKHLRRIRPSKSGPAITINVVMKDGKTFSVDFVPAFEFSLKFLPKNIQSRVENACPNSQRTWYAIPKGSKTESPANEWRTSLYEIERDMMRGYKHIKPCIRILKKLRDEQDWKALSSYYLKTMFMHMMKDNVEGWGLGRIIMHAMENLEERMRESTINYYWDGGHNLLDNASLEFCTNVSNYIRRIINKFKRSLEDDSVDPMVYFGCKRSYRYRPQSVSEPTDELEEGRQQEYGMMANTADPNCVVM